MEYKDLQDLKNQFNIIGNDAKLHEALEVAVQVAKTDLSILITGESGVGKEVIPQIIHRNSPRKHGTYIPVNCGAIPEGTIDSELFGHVKGAFTGATDNRKGYFEVADGGTIFLDEVAELPLTTQVRLLRVLQSGEFIKVGSSEVQKTNVRVVAATNVNLPHAIRNGKFREDLFYRLSTVPISLPPLRRRQGDILLLFTKFAVDFAEKYKMPPVRLTAPAKEMLQGYRWPGNVRQLKSVAEQMSILEEERTIGPDILQKYLPMDSGGQLTVLQDSQSDSEFMNEREKFYMALLQQLKMEVEGLKKDVERLSGGTGRPAAALEEVHPLPQAPERMEYHPALEAKRPAEALPVAKVAQVPAAEVTARELRDVKSKLNDYGGSIEDTDFEEGGDREEDLSIAKATEELIRKSLQRFPNKKEAADALGISERTLYRKIKELNLEDE